VEEAAAAADAMQEQAATLAQVVSTFRLDAATSAPGVAAQFRSAAPRARLSLVA